MVAVIAPQHTAFWQPQPEQYSIHFPDMTIQPGLFTVYNTSRAVTTSASQSFPATNTQMDINMSMIPSQSLATSVPYQSGAFAFNPQSISPYGMQQPFSGSYPYPQIQPVPSNSMRHVPPRYPVQRSIPNSPPVKDEAMTPVQSSPVNASATINEPIKQDISETGKGSHISFSTDVDTLMRAIQTQQKVKPSLNNHQTSSKGEECEQQASQKPKKYKCDLPDCNKDFYQKTHLVIHKRAHTGAKPYACKEPDCRQRFSQMGNLRTHERRHSGERPYTCEICGKSFAQRGNVRAHKIVHQRVKPFTCRLDDCGKQFTQLGNLKSHQNRFHQETVRYLAHKFSTFQEGDQVSQQDKQLWDYFASLYKNSNKGIKGRGKDRKISGPPSSVSSSYSYTSATVTSPSGDYAGSAHHSVSDRGSPCSSIMTTPIKADDSYDFSSTMTGSAYSATSSADVDVDSFPERKMYTY